MRSGLLKKLTFQDPLTNQLVANLSDAINTLSSDDDVFTAPSTVLVGTGKIPAGAATIFYRGAPGAQLTLPPAQSQAVQGTARAALVVLGNEASGAVTLLASGSDTINGAKSLPVAAGALAMVVSDGFSRWLVLAPAAGAPALIKSEAFSGVSSLTGTWDAGAYRRLELHMRVTTSGAGNAVATFAGLGGTYSSWSTYNQSGASIWGVGNFTNWTLGNAAYAGQTDATFQIGNGGLRTFQAETLDATNGYVLLSQGKNTDTTTAVTGLTLTFPGATSGWWELRGFA